MCTRRKEDTINLLVNNVSPASLPLSVSLSLSFSSTWGKWVCGGARRKHNLQTSATNFAERRGLKICIIISGTFLSLSLRVRLRSRSRVHTMTVMARWCVAHATNDVQKLQKEGSGEGGGTNPYTLWRVTLRLAPNWLKTLIMLLYYGSQVVQNCTQSRIYWLLSHYSAGGGGWCVVHGHPKKNIEEREQSKRVKGSSSCCLNSCYTFLLPIISQLFCPLRYTVILASGKAEDTPIRPQLPSPPPAQGFHRPRQTEGFVAKFCSKL